MRLELMTCWCWELDWYPFWLKSWISNLLEIIWCKDGKDTGYSPSKDATSRLWKGLNYFFGCRFVLLFFDGTPYWSVRASPSFCIQESIRISWEVLSAMNPRFNSSSFPQSAVKTAALLQTHGVNNAQAVKHGVVWGRQSGNAAQGACLKTWTGRRRWRYVPSSPK